MIISASRRTDIPAFYTPWFMNRVRAGYCTVPNPFNRAQVSRVSLEPADVSVIVFWTRHGRPLLRHLKELDDRGFRYFFLYTLMENPRWLDPKRPSLAAAVETFLRLSAHVGPERMIWRYDPIVPGTETSVAFHLETFRRIAGRLRGATRRSIISIVDIYRKNRGRMASLPGMGPACAGFSRPDREALLAGLSAIAREEGLLLTSCAEEAEVAASGIAPGKCIDSDYITGTFGVKTAAQKDPSQRRACGCVVSRDIGCYDTCLFGCAYCYATSSFKTAAKNHAAHRPDSPSLLGWREFA